MGKHKNKKKSKNNNNNNKPFVSICTPTFNRRPFIPMMIKCFEHQDYPKNRMEWIIIDDGTDKVEDLLQSVPQIKYFKYDKKMTLGKKRNLMHEKSRGDIIVYMDDDDYYPPQRVSHAVEMLQSHPDALCAGSSEIYIWFKHIQKMMQFGPYSPNHATAGTFAFKRKLLKDHSYEDNAALAEEKHFLKNYTVPFVQLDPKKVILVFSHEHNTFDKRKLLENPHPNFVKESDKTVDDFIKEPEKKDFYMNQIEGLLENYEPGRPLMKPDVLKQIIEIEETRRKEAEKMALALQKENNSRVLIQQADGTTLALSTEQVVQVLKQQQHELQAIKANESSLKQQITSLSTHIQDLTTQLSQKEIVLSSIQGLNKTLMKKLNGGIIDIEEEIENVTLTVKESQYKVDDISEQLICEINQKN